MDKKITESMDKHLAKYQELMGKRKALRARLVKVRAEKGSVKDTVFEKVLGEYRKQMEDLDNKVKPMKQEVEKTRDMIKDELAKIEEDVAALEDQLQEFSLRHRVGEFDDEELSKLNDPVQQQSQELDQRKNKLTQAERRLDETGAVAAEDTDKEPPASAAETKAPAAEMDRPAADAPDAKPTAGTGSGSSSSEADKKSAAGSHTQSGEADKKNAADSHTDQETPVAADSKTKGADVARKKDTAKKAPVRTADDAPEPDNSPSTPKPPAQPVQPIQPAAPTASTTSAGEASKRPGNSDDLVDTSEWSKEFEHEGTKSREGRRHTDKPAPVSQDADDDPLAALDVVFPSDSPATATKPQTTKGTGTSTKDRPKGFPVLIITKGPGSGKKLPLVPMTMTVGREHDNNIELKDDEVSRYHARISHESGQYVISDLDSSSGTWVNDEKVLQQALKHGDKIRVGATELVIDFE